MEVAATEVDEQRLEAFLGQAVTDMGAAMNGVLVMIGGELGLWEAMAGAGPLTTEEIAQRTDVSERYIREWASAQAASGYLTYDEGAETFELPPEQAMAFADKDSPVYMLGGYSLISSVYKDRAKLTERFREGAGFGWHEHHEELFVGTEQFFRPGYRAHLVAEWIPALEDVEDKLRQGGKVADIGCGHGISTILMAQAFPRIDRPRIRLPRRVDREGARDRRERGGRGQHGVRRRNARRTIRARAMTWSASSTVSTTWATRLAR